MKKMTIMALLMTLGMMMSGCSKTWNGIKQDTGEAWDASKKAVHNATAQKLPLCSIGTMYFYVVPLLLSDYRFGIC